MKFKVILVLLFFYGLTNGQTDIAIAINGSGSISPTEFQLQKDAIISCLRKLPTSGTTGFSLIQYAGGSEVVHVPYTLLLPATNIAAIEASIQAVIQIIGNTNSGDGIIAAANEIINNGTSGHRKVVLLATDGQTNMGTPFSTAVTTIQIGIDELGIIVIDNPSVLPFYAPHPFGGGTAEFAANFAEFEAVLDKYCISLVTPIPTMSQWGLFILGLIMTSLAVVKIRKGVLAIG